MKLFSSLTLFIATFLLISCDDEQLMPIDLLPEATSIGANTFGCLIDGELFVPDYDGGLFSPDEIIVTYRWFKGHQLYIAVRRESSQLFEDIEIHADSIDLGGVKNRTYNIVSTEDVLSRNGNFYCFYGIESNETGDLSIYATTRISGKITITQFGDGVASGTFWFDAVNIDNDLDTVKVREGRFDIEI